MSSNFSRHLPICSDSIVSGHIYLFFTSTNVVLLLPLSLFILHLGFQRWRQQRSSSSAAAMSLSDFVTYNIAAMELIGTAGYAINICSYFTGRPDMWVGIVIGSFPWSGQMFFPVFTCVERYLAAVHPITYLRLRRESGTRIRNIGTGYIWLQSFAGMCFILLLSKRSEFDLIPNTILNALFLITLTFCSLSVLCVLVRPRPGAAGRDGARCDQSKQKAFHAIVIITGVLWLRFGGNLACNLVGLSSASYSVRCVMKSAMWCFNLPSNLVLPVLFLRRAGKLPGCHHNTEPG